MFSKNTYREILNFQCSCKKTRILTLCVQANDSLHPPTLCRRLIRFERRNSQHDTTVICIPLNNLQTTRIFQQEVTERRTGSPVLWSHLRAGSSSRLRPSSSLTFYLLFSTDSVTFPYFLTRVCPRCPLLT